MGLTGKILLFIATLVVLLVGGTLAFTTVQADRLARGTIDAGLKETRDVWQTIQDDRFKKLRLGVRVLANDPYFKAAIAERDQNTTLDSLGERGQDLAADFMMATDPSGKLVARTDRPSDTGDDLSADPIVKKALDGEDAASLWLQGDQIYTAVAVPMQTGPELVGVLLAGYRLNEAVAAQIHKLTHSDIAFLVRPAGQPEKLAVSSLGPSEPALVGALAMPAIAQADAPFEIDLAGDRHVGIRIPLASATGEPIGAALALRSLSAETVAFRRFRNVLVAVSLGVMALGLLAAWVAASRITGPVRKLVGLVERIRDGSYSGAVAVQGRDEIGVLARAFNALVADLREKDQMISFLRDGMTEMRKVSASTGAGSIAASGGPAASTPVSAADAPTVPVQAQDTRGASLQRGDVFANRYEVLGTLGKGGMGVVYRARDRQLDEVVALKLLRPEALATDPTLIDRFKQEIKLARRITHRNVLRTHDFGEAGTRALHLDGVPRGRHAQGPDPQPRRAAARRRALDRQADVPRARRGARDGRRAPRHQAAEHADPARDRRAEDHGLRHLARVVGRAGHLGPHDRGHGDGHARLHAARSRPRASQPTSAPTSTRWPSCSSRPSPASCRSGARTRWRWWWRTSSSRRPSRAASTRSSRPSSSC